MGPQDSSLLHQQYHSFPGQSSDVDFEAAEQLLQHSRRGRESNGDSMPESALEPEASINLPGRSADQVLEDGHLENGNENAESHLQERLEESQYAPMSNQPPLGQVCRYAQSYPLRVCSRCLWWETDTLFSVTAALLAHLFGVDRQMVRLSVTLADCIRRHEIHLDQQI